MKVGVLIPTLAPFEVLFQSMDCLRAMSGNVNIVFYVGVHRDEAHLLTKIPIVIFPDELVRGNVVALWNYLAVKAVDDGCEIIFQTGDDIKYLTPKFLETLATFLQSSPELKLAAPIDIDNVSIPTQAMVKAEHIKKLGYLFAPELKNWYCDFYIQRLYTDRFHGESRVVNLQGGGRSKPRYVIDHTAQKTFEMYALRDRAILFDDYRKISSRGVMYEMPMPFEGRTHLGTM